MRRSRNMTREQRRLYRILWGWADPYWADGPERKHTAHVYRLSNTSACGRWSWELGVDKIPRRELPVGTVPCRRCLEISVAYDYPAPRVAATRVTAPDNVEEALHGS